MATRQQEALGPRIARLRRAAKLTQVELAAKSALTPDAIRKIEQGVTKDMKSSTVLALADVLDVSVGAVLGVK
jgi:transcriptional regulator with XRE-family HTH domain